MRKFVIVALLSALVASAASAQAVVYRKGDKHGVDMSPVGGYNYADSLTYPMQVNSAGATLTTRTPNTRNAGTAIINSAGLATAGSDSSIVFSTAGYRQLALQFRVPGCVAKIAVQVRYHLNATADSVSTFPIDGRHFAYADSSTAKDVSPTATVIGAQEFLCSIFALKAGTINTNAWSNKTIPIMSTGGPFWYDYISVRIRYLGGNAASMPIAVYLIGTDL